MNKRMYNCARGGIQNKPAEMFTEVSELINTEASNHWQCQILRNISQQFFS